VLCIPGADVAAAVSCFEFADDGLESQADVAALFMPGSKRSAALSFGGAPGFECP